VKDALDWGTSSDALGDPRRRESPKREEGNEGWRKGQSSDIKNAFLFTRGTRIRSSLERVRDHWQEWGHGFWEYPLEKEAGASLGKEKGRGTASQTPDRFASREGCT